MRTITVGIPSYNEQGNIVSLLQSLEEQRSIISEVIISDDSSDMTHALVRNFAERSPLDIRVFHHETRRGAAAAWNEIFHRATSDIILLYDADIIPHPSCTMELSSHVLENATVCASNSKPIQASGIAGRATVFISNWLRSVRMRGLSQYTVMGRALAIDAAVARKIQIPEEMIAIDLYLQCKVLEMGLGVGYNDNAIVYFKPPTNMRDMVSQLMRALNGHSQITDVVYRVGISFPLHVAALLALKNTIRDPVGAVSTILGYSAIPYYISRLKHTDSAKWHTAKSSKVIDYQQLKTRF